MADMNNDAYLLFLKQEQILKQSQAANINRQLEQENQMALNEMNNQMSNGENGNNSEIGSNHLEKVLDFMAKQNQLNMNVHLNNNNNREE